MKKLLSLVFIIALVMGFSACDKNLDLAPIDSFGSGNFWKDPAQVDGAMSGLHSQLRGYQFTFYILGEMRGGVLNSGTGFTGTSSLNSTSYITQDIRESNPGVSNWGGFYGAIFQVNNFIFEVEAADYLSASDKGYYLGQAYGLRAFYYFYLYRSYGRVPLATEPTVLTNTPTSSDQAFLPRSKTEKETLDFIKADIDQSVQHFNGNYASKGGKSLWSLGATNMLKAEVYLWSAKVKTDGQAPSEAQMTSDLTTARNAIEDLIPHYSLMSDFNDVIRKKGNDEIIFSLRYQIGEATNNFSQFVYQAADGMSGFVNSGGGSLVPNRYQTDAAKTGDPLDLRGNGIIRYEYNYNLFLTYDTANDTRARGTFFDYYRAPATASGNKAIMLTKFIGEIDNGNRVFDDDVPVYRLAEAYLLLAEIKNKLGDDPSAEMDLVRERAYKGKPYPHFIDGTFEQNELAIFEERGKELVGEGKRWFDLRRMQDASGSPLAFRTDLPLVGVISASEAHKLILPIDRNTLTEDDTLINDQNPEYSGT